MYKFKASLLSHESRRLGSHCCGFNKINYYFMEHLSLKCLLARLTGKGHAVPRCTDTEIKRTVPVSQRLRSKDKARYNRWKQTDGGKQENNDTMSASMTGSQLSTPVVCLGSFLQESQQNAGCATGKSMKVLVCTLAQR